jgi:phosphate starvation-inducible membrane PsiE
VVTKFGHLPMSAFYEVYVGITGVVCLLYEWIKTVHSVLQDTVSRGSFFMVLSIFLVSQNVIMKCSQHAQNRA